VKFLLDMGISLHLIPTFNRTVTKLSTSSTSPRARCPMPRSSPQPGRRATCSWCTTWTFHSSWPRRERLERLFASLSAEIATADALDADSLARAVEGCDLVVDAIGLPPERMADHPATARNVAAATGAAGARCLLVSW
jgi:hypothetical protein